MVLRGRPRGRAGHRRNTLFKEARPIWGGPLCLSLFGAWPNRGTSFLRIACLPWRDRGRPIGPRTVVAHRPGPERPRFRPPAPPLPQAEGRPRTHAVQPVSPISLAAPAAASLPDHRSTTAGQPPQARAHAADPSRSPWPMAHLSHPSRFSPVIGEVPGDHRRPVMPRARRASGFPFSGGRCRARHA